MDGQDLHDPVGDICSEGVPSGKPPSAGNTSGPHPRPVSMPYGGVGQDQIQKLGTKVIHIPGRAQVCASLWMWASTSPSNAVFG